MSYRSLAVLLVLAAACNKAKSAAPGGAGGMPPMPVEVSAVIRDTVVDAIAATGQIEAVQSIELRPEVQGRIIDILVREGQPVDAGTALFKVDDAELKARAPNPEHQLQAGMFIEARLATDIRPNALVVPEDAILPVQGSTYVWVVKDGKADRRQVTIGVRTAGWAEIEGGGVQAGDQVVVGGLERLFPGAPVMPQVVERHRGAPTGAESTAATGAARGGTPKTR